MSKKIITIDELTEYLNSAESVIYSKNDNKTIVMNYEDLKIEFVKQVQELLHTDPEEIQKKKLKKELVEELKDLLVEKVIEQAK